MKKYLATSLAVLATLIMMGSASAQTPGAAAGTQKPLVMQGKRQKTLLDVLSKLNLTPDQKSKIKLQIKKSADAVRTIRSDFKAGKLTKDDAKKKSQAIRKENRESIKAILTPAQTKQFTTLMKEAQKENKANRAAGGGKPKVGG